MKTDLEVHIRGCLVEVQGKRRTFMQILSQGACAKEHKVLNDMDYRGGDTSDILHPSLR
jgi:hypothetical protein